MGGFLLVQSLNCSLGRLFVSRFCMAQKLRSAVDQGFPEIFCSLPNSRRIDSPSSVQVQIDSHPLRILYSLSAKLRNRFHVRIFAIQIIDSLLFPAECLAEEAGSVDHELESVGVGHSIWRGLRRRSLQAYRSPSYCNVISITQAINAGQSRKGRCQILGRSILNLRIPGQEL